MLPSSSIFHGLLHSPELVCKLCQPNFQCYMCKSHLPIHVQGKSVSRKQQLWHVVHRYQPEKRASKKKRTSEHYKHHAAHLECRSFLLFPDIKVKAAKNGEAHYLNKSHQANNERNNINPRLMIFRIPCFVAHNIRRICNRDSRSSKQMRDMWQCGAII